MLFTDLSVLLRKGQAVCASVLSRIALVGADMNSLQRAVVAASAVVNTILNCAMDASIDIFQRKNLFSPHLAVTIAFHTNDDIIHLHPIKYSDRFPALI